MANGIKVYNQNDGSLSFDIGSRLFRVIARVNYNNANGSATFARSNAEDTALVAVPRGWYAPTFSVNVGTNTVSWDFSSIPAAYRYPGVVDIWAS